MRECPECLAEIEEGEESWRSIDLGHEVEDDYPTCPYCGEMLEDDDE